ncbi:gp53-like domain-containing protein [Citrobacter freundii]|uniref:gp53-like domain-containing protein n=1 Tax=Citrobacter freundii TaxID=546 RepID=UPI003F8E3046
MFHVDNSTGIPVMPQPSPVTSETELFFTEGGNGVPPTYPGPDWFNTIQSELLHILRAAGLDPDKMDNTQILAALKKLFLSRSNPFGDIKADGAAAIATALSNLGLGTAAKKNVGTGANQIPDMNSFQSGSGWFKLPSGHIIQYGSVGVGNPNAQAFTNTANFNIPFTTDIYGVIAIAQTTASTIGLNVIYTTTNNSLTAFTVRGDINENGSLITQNQSFFYIALGK